MSLCHRNSLLILFLMVTLFYKKAVNICFSLGQWCLINISIRIYQHIKEKRILCKISQLAFIDIANQSTSLPKFILNMCSGIAIAQFLQEQVTKLFQLLLPPIVTTA